jgi:hypothetical protein
LIGRRSDSTYDDGGGRCRLYERGGRANRPHRSRDGEIGVRGSSFMLRHGRS